MPPPPSPLPPPGVPVGRQLRLQTYLDAYTKAYAEGLRRAVYADAAFNWDVTLPVATNLQRRAQTPTWESRMRDLETLCHHVAGTTALAAGIPSWKRLRAQVYARDQGTCWVCGATVAWRYYELGHLVDRVMGGLDLPENLAVMCNLCNRARKPCHATMAEAIAWRASYRESFVMPHRALATFS